MTSAKNECNEAKEKEFENFEKFKEFEEVADTGQNVLGTRFVLTQKDDNKIKARFVIKGFQEAEMQSDSPTISRETLKIFCSIAANEKWSIEMSDVQAAFLQSNELKRDVYVERPKHRKKPGFFQLRNLDTFGHGSEFK